MAEIEIKEVKKYILSDKIKWTEHCSFRMFEREIHQVDVQMVILNGKIIEQYPEAYPYPSCLITGRNLSNQILHVVCGIGDDNLYIITVYRPDEEKWIDDTLRRK